MARLVEAVATGRHPDTTPAWQLQRCGRDLGQRPGASSSRKRRAVRPAVAGLRLVCATPRRRPTAAGLTGRGGRLPVGRRVRNASVRPRVHKTAPDVAPGPNIAYLLLKGGPVTLIAGRPAQPL
jgi:hypothetical protein